MIWMLLPLLLVADPESADAEVALSDLVATLVAELGDDDYRHREAAQAALASLPAQALPHISRAYRDSTDAEVRMRLRLYADHYFERHVLAKFEDLKRPGYLGIMQQDGRLDDGAGFVQVVKVMPGTGAEEAGLEAGDRIIAINGNPMPASNATLAVARYIQAHQAGDEIRCTVLRGEQSIEITATLGGLPDEHLDPEKREQLERVRQQLREQWWSAGFLAGDLNFQPDLSETDAGEP